ncbi:YgaP family membrane protein [Tranquillimonas alkanivorans]|uniref:Inner membrane protein YgaP-like transmembrane domain-containing protein n=1 Tax=Tranquillimonas alkanivorans TaxID=441119 RepID=A0A1I5T2B7_9RHOB|nr:DUF2892 domain-containing protein [Tranquillimonas alkanivorans]SFP76991.1 Protein of unknown function [Tranquillimonas alkanivorans]
MSLERTILLVVGVVILGSLLLGVFVAPGFLWITALMGAHLVQASFTGFCPVVRLLKRMGLPERSGFA